MRYTDMIRITENINYIMEAARDKGYVIYGEYITYTTWVRNDIITLTQWTEILTSLLAVVDGIHYVYETEPDNGMTWHNINVVEELTLTCKTIIESSTDMSRINHWVGDDLFSGDQVNAGGTY